VQTAFPNRAKQSLNMPLLIYCVAGAAASLNGLQTGVAGSPVLRLEVANLAAFVSRSADSSGWLRSPLRTSALEFHRVLRQLFSATAILPFRFPTIFEHQSELAQHLEGRSGEYGALLEKFSSFAQMEARVGYPDSETAIAARSGAEYLLQRQRRFHRQDNRVIVPEPGIAEGAEQIRRVALPIVLDDGGDTGVQLRSGKLREREPVPSPDHDGGRDSRAGEGESQSSDLVHPGAVSGQEHED